MTLGPLAGALDRRPLLSRALAAGPERVVLVAVALAVAAGITVSAGQFRPYTTLPLAAVLLVATWRALAPRTTARDAVGATVALAMAAIWTLLNLLLAAEYLIVVRDPGFLTLSGLWLTTHPSTDIPAMDADTAAALQPNLLPDASQAWNLRGDVIQPQGAKMLPATIAIAGWVGGESAVLGANIAIGAVGILAIYALSRLALGPIVALAPAAAIALSVSHIALSRAAYTEPLTLVLVVVGALWAWRGVVEKRLPLIVGAAVASGATSLIRIDGAIFAAGTLLGLVLALALAEHQRRWRATAATVGIAVQAGAVLLGYASLWRWSEAYAERLSEQVTALSVGYAAFAGLLIAWSVTWWWRGDRVLVAARDALGRKGAIAVGIAVGALLTVLASRPLWTTVHRGAETAEDRFTVKVVESFQAAQGLPVDGTRTYAEHTFAWMSYYLTWPVVLLGIAGLAIAATRSLRGSGQWGVLAMTALAPTLLYAWNPEIVPDQIWAIRRFEPVTLPALAIGAAVGALAIVGRFPHDRQRRWRRVSLWCIAMLPVAGWVSLAPGSDYPIGGATPLVIREQGGARTALHELCDIAPGRPIVLAGTSSHFGSLRVMCDEPVVLALVAPTADTLATMTEVFGVSPVVITRNPEWFEWDRTPDVVVTATVRQSSYSLGEIPRTYFDSAYAWNAGIVRSDGTLASTSPKN